MSIYPTPFPSEIIGESVSDYLARGGTIQQIPIGISGENPDSQGFFQVSEKSKKEFIPGLRPCPNRKGWK
jgi:hypothetical protein